MQGIRQDVVNVSWLCINQIKLLGFFGGILFACGPFCATSFEISTVRVFRKRSKSTRSSSLYLHKLRRRLHLWRCSKIWMAGVCLNCVSNSIPKSWWMGNWKYVRNAVARAPKVPCEAEGCYTYHFTTTLVRVSWNNLNRIVLSMILFDENHRWKVMTWLPRSSACLPLNFVISKGSFVGMGGHVGLCAMGSFVNLVKSGKFNCYTVFWSSNLLSLDEPKYTM